MISITFQATIYKYIGEIKICDFQPRDISLHCYVISNGTKLHILIFDDEGNPHMLFKIRIWYGKLKSFFVGKVCFQLLFCCIVKTSIYKTKIIINWDHLAIELTPNN